MGARRALRVGIMSEGLSPSQECTAVRVTGGAIADTLIVFRAGVLMGPAEKLTRGAAAQNPFYAGASADLLALIPFALLSVPLFLVGREKLLARRARRGEQLRVRSPRRTHAPVAHSVRFVALRIVIKSSAATLQLSGRIRTASPSRTVRLLGTTAALGRCGSPCHQTA